MELSNGREVAGPTRIGGCGPVVNRSLVPLLIQDAGSENAPRYVPAFARSAPAVAFRLFIFPPVQRTGLGRSALRAGSRSKTRIVQNVFPRALNTSRLLFATHS